MSICMINGVKINVPNDSSVQITNGKIYINGEEVKSFEKEKSIDVKIDGDIEDLKVSGNITCNGNIQKAVAYGNIKCKNIQSTARAEGNIMCDNITGDARAAGNIMCNKII